MWRYTTFQLPGRTGSATRGLRWSRGEIAPIARGGPRPRIGEGNMAFLHLNEVFGKQNCECCHFPGAKPTIRVRSGAPLRLWGKRAKRGSRWAAETDFFDNQTQRKKEGKILCRVGGELGHFYFYTTGSGDARLNEPV